jgi:hypothetical protein
MEASIIVDHLAADADWLRGVYQDAADRGELAEAGRLLVEAHRLLEQWVQAHRWSPPALDPCSHDAGYCAACEPFVVEVPS